MLLLINRTGHTNIVLGQFLYSAIKLVEKFKVCTCTYDCSCKN